MANKVARRTTVVSKFREKVSVLRFRLPTHISCRHQKAIDWFTTIQQSVHPVLNKSRRKSIVRIAILGNGVDPTLLDFHQPLTDYYIKCARAFPEALDPLKDLHDRGTHAVSVLMRIVPAAAVFIARVVDDEGRLCAENDYVATAEVTPFDTLH